MTFTVTTDISGAQTAIRYRGGSMVQVTAEYLAALQVTANEGGGLVTAYLTNEDGEHTEMESQMVRAA